MNILWLSRISRYDTLHTVCTLARCITKWTVAFDKKFRRTIGEHDIQFGSLFVVLLGIKLRIATLLHLRMQAVPTAWRTADPPAEGVVVGTLIIRCPIRLWSYLSCKLSRIPAHSSPETGNVLARKSRDRQRDHPKNGLCVAMMNKGTRNQI